MKKPKKHILEEDIEEFEGGIIPVLQPQGDNYSRYVMISGNGFSITIASDNEREDINFLSRKAISLIKKIKSLDR